MDNTEEEMDNEENMDTVEENMGDSGGSSSDSDSEADEAMDEKQQEELWQKVKELRQQVKENSLYYDGHVNLIAALRELAELDEARKAREKMSEAYPLTPELWMDWIQDEQKVCTTDEERQYIVSLFKRAVKDYTSVRVWVEYVMFMLGCGDLGATREVGEHALTAAGTHVAEGALVWQVVLLVEKQVYSGLQKPGAVLSENEKMELEKQLQRIQSLYRRQMSVPLLNCTPESLQEEALEYFENGIDNQMKITLEKAHKRLQEKTPFEDELLQAQNEADKLAAYRRYITATKESDNPAAVQNLYERAVLDLCLVEGLWEEYVSFAIHQFSGLDYVVLPLCERSQRNCPWSASLCEHHITALQMFAAEGEEKNTAQKIKRVLEKGLGCGLQYGSVATRMWMSYLIFLRRQIKWDQPHEEELTFFRDAGQQAINMIDQYFGDEGDIESEIPRFLARIEAEFAMDIERMREIWNDVIMKRNNNFKKAEFWLEFINLERSYGTEKHCRKLLRRALERVWDGVEGIGQAFLCFEQETGNLESMNDFKKRYKDRMVIVNNKRAEDAAKLEAEMSPKTENKTNKQREKKGKQQKAKKEYSHNVDSQKKGSVFKVPHPVTNVPRGNKDTSASRSRSVFHDFPKKVASPPGFKDTHEEKEGFKVPPPPGFKESVAAAPDMVEPPPGYRGDAPKQSRDAKRQAENTEEAQAKKLKIEKQHGVLTQDAPRDEMCTLFISNLDYKIDKNDIIPFFQKCGEINDFRLVKDFKCRSKGFGYLVFRTHEGAKKGLELDRTLLNGRPVFVSPYDPENHTHKFRYATGLEEEKLFIRGLPFTMTEDDIKEAFLPHGEIKSIRLVTYRNGHSKGTCYIEYHDAETAAKVQQAMDGTELGDKTINVLISNPSGRKTYDSSIVAKETVFKSNPSVRKTNESPTKETTLSDNPPAKKTNESPAAPRETVLGGGSKQRKAAAGGRGKGMFSLMPRALQRAPPPPATPKSDSSQEQTIKLSNEDFRNMLLKK